MEYETMTFDLNEATAVLTRTPATLRALLAGLPEPWIRCDEGDETWSPFDVLGHLIHGDRTDWVPRARIIMEHGEARPFEPFDRFAMLDANVGRTLVDLLDEFEQVRAESLQALAQLVPPDTDLERPGMHPELGPVTLGALLATWVVHDLNHIHQIVRAMANRYRADVGPWHTYLGILNRR
jgi:hypothetical protein